MSQQAENEADSEPEDGGEEEPEREVSIFYAKQFSKTNNFAGEHRFILGKFLSQGF